MSEVRKVLAQVDLDATTSTDIYTVPSNAQAVVSSIVVCNRDSAATTFRVSVGVGGATLGAKQYLYYDVALPANDSFTATIGMTLGSRDVIRAYAGATTVSVSVFGVEIAG